MSLSVSRAGGYFPSVIIVLHDLCIVTLCLNLNEFKIEELASKNQPFRRLDTNLNVWTNKPYY